MEFIYFDIFLLSKKKKKNKSRFFIYFWCLSWVNFGQSESIIEWLEWAEKSVAKMRLVKNDKEIKLKTWWWKRGESKPI